MVAHERFIRYHGERYAQLDDNRSVHDLPDTESSLWFKIIIPLLFFTPHNYGERLRLLYLDKKVNYTVWRKFIAELREDWKNSIIPVRAISVYSPHLADHAFVHGVVNRHPER